MSKTHIITCTCNSEFQDKEHGKGQRVGNVQDKTVDKNTNRKQVVCTVCGKTHDVWR